jgi:hypothetical protein
MADLDRFLGQLPKGWPYGVGMRSGIGSSQNSPFARPVTRSRGSSVSGKQPTVLRRRSRPQGVVYPTMLDHNLGTFSISEYVAA